MESASRTFETEITLNHDDEIDNQNIKDPLPFMFKHDHLDPIKDADYELIDEHNLQNHASLDYMNRMVDCHHEINSITDKQTRKWRTIKHLFQRVTNPRCIAQFCKHT